jgi:hypothetical protein
VLDFPQLTGGGMQRGRLHIPVADRPDLATRTIPAGERIVRGNAAIGFETHDFAKEAVHALRLHAPRRDGSIAERDEKFSIAREYQSAAEMEARCHRGRLMENHLYVFNARLCTINEFPACNRRVVHATVTRFSVAPVNQVVAGVVWMHSNVEQPALSLGINGWQPGDSG